MKKIAAIVCLLLALCAVGASAQRRQELKTEIDSVSYAIGMNIGNSLRQDSIYLNPDLLYFGTKDAVADKALLSEEEKESVLTRFQQKIMEKVQARMMAQQDSLNKLGELNEEDGNLFLADNGKKKGIVTLESGLQYKVLKEGKGKKPKTSDNVKVRYIGTLIDGSEFDGNMDDEEPVTINVGGMIPGWTEALKKMKTGSKWRIFIPPALAYGNNPPPEGIIQPGSVLIYEIELIDIVKE